MALQCGSNFFGGSGSHEQPIRRGQTGVAVAIALSLAFAKAWAAISEDYAEKCPDTCKRKTGQVGLKVTSSIVNNRVTFTFAYILLVRCSPTAATPPSRSSETTTSSRNLLRRRFRGGVGASPSVEDAGDGYFE